MDKTITHDTLFKDDIMAQFGPNFLPLLKVFSLVIAFIFVIIILMTNLSTTIQAKEPEIQYMVSQLDEPVIVVNQTKRI
jgi:hypothetical protein